MSDYASRIITDLTHGKNVADATADFNQMLYGKTAYQSLYEPVIYQPSSGDRLSKIIHDYYDIHVNDPSYKYALAHVLHNNPRITNPDSLSPLQLITLPPLAPHYGPTMCFSAEGELENAKIYDASIAKRNNIPRGFMARYVDDFASFIPTDPTEREIFWVLAWLQNNHDFLNEDVNKIKREPLPFSNPAKSEYAKAEAERIALRTGVRGTANALLSQAIEYSQADASLVSAGIGLNVLGGLTSKNNNYLVQKLNNLYLARQRGELGKQQYRNNVKNVMKVYTKRVGPLGNLMFDGQSAQQALRTNKVKGYPNNADLVKYAARLKFLSEVASKGGLLLTAYGVYVNANKMCAADTRHEKNEILFETAGSVIYGAACAFVLFSNPVGWGMALVLGASAAIGSYGVGKGASFVYNLSGTEVDLVSATGIEKLVCK